jgi:hypothetical protein
MVGEVVSNRVSFRNNGYSGKEKKIKFDQRPTGTGCLACDLLPRLLGAQNVLSD